MPTRIFSFGGSSDVFDFAFFGDAFSTIDETAHQLTLRNLSTGAVIKLFGSNFDQRSETVSMVTGFSIATDTIVTPIASMFLSEARRFDNFWDGMTETLGSDTGAVDPKWIASLIGEEYIFDGSAAEDGVDMSFRHFSNLAGPSTILGSDGSDFLIGSRGDDRILSATGFDVILGSGGNDTIDLSDGNGRFGTSGASLIYGPLEGGGIFAQIDTGSGLARIDKPDGGSDTLLNVQDVLLRENLGFSIIGTAARDVFHVVLEDRQSLTLRPGGGDDLIVFASDAVNAQLTLDYSWNGLRSPDSGLVADLGQGVITSDGFGGRDEISLGTGPQSTPLELMATDLADDITGSAQSEVFFLRGGNDTLDAGGRNDTDVLNYSLTGMGTGVTVDLSQGRATGSWLNTAFTHTLSNVEDVYGTISADDIVGDEADNFLVGLDGDDRLEGGAGQDLLWGGAGNDLLRDIVDTADHFGDDLAPGAGQDTIEGNAAAWARGDGTNLFYRDLGSSGPGLTVTWTDGTTGSGQVTGDDVNDVFSHVDFIEGSAGSDFFVFADFTQDVAVTGGPGDDSIRGGAGTLDRLHYGINDGPLGINLDAGAGRAIDGFGHTDRFIGIELFQGGNQNDRMQAGETGITFMGDHGSDTLIGGAGDDRLYGMTDSIRANPETDSLDLRDLIYGGDGDDTIDGGAGNDELRGDAGNDDIAGGAGADTVIGGAGDDVMTGSNFGDVIFGGDGFDFINGGFGSDRLNGGNDADRFFHVGVAGHGSDWIQDYDAAEGDVLLYGGSATIDQFQVNRANTANAGEASVDEAFVIYKPSGQILWALVDGFGNDAINIRIGGVEYDLLG